jgi:hypothetical protein
MNNTDKVVEEAKSKIKSSGVWVHKNRKLLLGSAIGIIVILVIWAILLAQFGRSDYDDVRKMYVPVEGSDAGAGLTNRWGTFYTVTYGVAPAAGAIAIVLISLVIYDFTKDSPEIEEGKDDDDSDPPLTDDTKKEKEMGNKVPPSSSSSSVMS